jgi:hypothetical protein
MYSSKIDAMRKMHCQKLIQRERNFAWYDPIQLLQNPTWMSLSKNHEFHFARILQSFLLFVKLSQMPCSISLFQHGVV